MPDLVIYVAATGLVLGLALFFAGTYRVIGLCLALAALPALIVAPIMWFGGHGASAPLRTALTDYMALREGTWTGPNADRTRNVTPVICPMVKPETLQQIEQDRPGFLNTGLASREMGLAPGTRYWSIRRPIGWPSTHVLSILTHEDGYCHASYLRDDSL